jgi:hypothetical protein
MVVSADTINQFKWFAEAGKRLIPGLVEEAAAPKESAVVDEATKKQFLAFVDRAIPLATRHGAEYLTWLSVEAEGLHHWIAEHDLIAIAGQTFVEDTYTRVLGWALAPPGRPDVALWVQQALLARLGIQHPGDHPMEVILWLSTEDGVPDLVLRGGRLGVVIEAKTCSLEHATPSRDPQTVAYPRALLAEQELETVHTVFLTLDGRAPASPEALPLTYAELARSSSHTGCQQR